MEEYLRETPDGFAIRGELSERQVMALKVLWESWTAEKGEDFHSEAWVAYMKVMVTSGR